MEMEKVPRAGYPITGLPITGLQRSLSLSNLAFPFKLIRSLLKARGILRDFRPQAAVGVGGFASGPLLLAAAAAGIPTLIQEQNSHAGITNRWLSRKAAKICVAYPGMDRFFPKEKLLLTGNPVRNDILLARSQNKAAAVHHFGLPPGRKVLFVMGGSLGARSINESTGAGLERLAGAGYQVIWQTGKHYIGQAQALIARCQVAASVRAFDFIYEMDLAYAAADVVVSRAGALSVSEICLAGKPSILVPYPFAAEDHQTSNALSLVSGNAALLVKDQETGSTLVAAAIGLLENESLQRELSANCLQLARPEAAGDIAREILKLI